MLTQARRFLPRRQVQTAFETIYPELLSRISAVAKRFSDPDEAAGEMLAFAWSVAWRRGVLLHPGLLAWASAVRVRSGRMLTGSSSTDVHAPMTPVQNRARVIHLSALSASKREQTLSDTTVESIVFALTSRENDRPDIRAAVRIDWAAFAERLDYRMRRILHWLSIGATRTWIAKKLKLSNGRVTQLVDVLASEVQSFFGDDIVPGAWRQGQA